jgi:hypothetical protein
LFLAYKKNLINTMNTQDYKKHTRIYSLDDAKELHEAKVKEKPLSQPHYRGEQVHGWNIEAGIFRRNQNERRLSGLEGRVLEQHATELFKEKMVQCFGSNVFKEDKREGKYGKYWDLVCQAQHAGIKTTLTDWSADICTAMYFATEFSTDYAKENADAQLWYFDTPRTIIFSDNASVFDDLNPLDMQTAIMFNPSHFTFGNEDRPQEKRMYNQEGRFFMSKTNEAQFPANIVYSNRIFRFVIPANCKQKIRQELREKGINKDSMYLQENKKLDTLADEINSTICALKV